MKIQFKNPTEIFVFRLGIVVAFLAVLTWINYESKEDSKASFWLQYKMSNGQTKWIQGSSKASFESEFPDAKQISFSTRLPESSSPQTTDPNRNNKEFHTSEPKETSQSKTTPDYSLSKKEGGERRKPSSAWNSLRSGDSPYQTKFGIGVYDKAFRNRIKFINDNSSDAIILLRQIGTDKVMRNEYLKKGETFEMTSIPNGSYYVQYYHGNDWNPGKIVLPGVKGGFEYDESFSESLESNPLVLNQDQTTYSTYEITLYQVLNGNFESLSLDANGFFKE